MKKAILFILVLLIFSASVYAHQPRIVSSDFTSIQNPEVSQAFYGELKGKENYFQINSDKPFYLHVSVLVPDVKNIDKDVSAEVSSGNKLLFLLNGTNVTWTVFYEEFGGDYYFQGPENALNTTAGIYDIKIFSPDNKGKYVLVVGDKEEFPLNEIVKTLVTLPILKKDFFEKSPFTAYFNKIGEYLLVFLVFVAIAVLVILLLIKKLRNLS